MRAAIYTRVSSEEQAKGEKFSIATQLADCESHCQRQGDIVAKKYSDIQSGADALKDRAQFERMLSDAKLGAFDKIVVWRPDRLFRGLKPAAKLATVLDETRIAIEGVQQTIDRNMIGLWAWVAEQELNTMKQRMGAGKRAKATELGKWGGGFTKYGYKYNTNKMSSEYTGKLAVEEIEANVVRGLFQWIDEGKKAADWCRWANEKGIPTKRKSLGWTPQEASELLGSECYTGIGAYGKLTRKGNKLIPADNPVEMKYPQIITSDLFKRAHEKLHENKRKNNGSTIQDRTYILHHLGRCGVCGGPLCCNINGIRGYRYIYCLNQRRFPHIHKCLKPQNQHLGMIEDYIWAEIVDVLEDYRNQTYELLIDRFEKANADREKQLARAEKEVERCNKERQRVLIMVRKEYVTQAEAEIQFIEIRKNQQNWQQEFDKLKLLEANTDSAWEDFRSLLKQVDGNMDFSFHPSTGQKKQVLNTLLQEFVLYPDVKIELRFKLPVNEKQVAETVLTLSRNDYSFGNSLF